MAEASPADRAGGDRRHPVFSRMYARLAPRLEQEGLATLRDELLAGLRGTVVEVGAGNGLNFAHYPSEVTRVVAVEPEPFLRSRAGLAARDAHVPIEVTAGRAESLPLPQASVDAGVVSLVLCSVDDPLAALAELSRVIRPGGELRFLEHVVAAEPALRAVQRGLDLTVWPHLAGGCHTGRDSLGAITTTGFRLRRLRRLRFPSTQVPLPTSPHVLGIAERSSRAAGD